MFNIRIVNLNASSYLCMTPEKVLCKGGEVEEGLVPSGLTVAQKDYYSYGLICIQNIWSGGLSRTEEIRRTTQLQAEAAILRNVWLCAGKDVTSNSEIVQPASPRPLRQRGVYPAATRADEWVGDGTACTLAWLNQRRLDGTDEKRGIQGRGNVVV